MYTGAAFGMAGLVEVLGCFSIDTTILHTLISVPVCIACTDMVYSKELERDVTNYRDGKGDTVPENFGIYSFIEHDRFDILRFKDK